MADPISKIRALMRRLVLGERTKRHRLITKAELTEVSINHDGIALGFWVVEAEDVAVTMTRKQRGERRG